MQNGQRCTPLVVETQGLNSFTWPELLATAFVELDFEPLEASNRSSHARILQYSFGDLAFQQSATSGPAHRVTRSQYWVDRSIRDNYYIGLLLSGSASLTQDGHRAALQPGDIAILDSSRPYCIDAARVFEAIWIKAPRSTVEQRLQQFTSVMANRINGKTGVGRLASDFLRGALEQAPLLTFHEAHQVIHSLLDIINMALTRPAGRRTQIIESPSQALLKRVKSYIESHLFDKGLSSTQIAKANHVSIRYINRLLRKEGSSIGRWIQGRRLDLCFQALQDPACRSRQVKEIAYGHGFANMPHFTRQFRLRYQVTPGVHRKNAGVE